MACQQQDGRKMRETNPPELQPLFSVTYSNILADFGEFGSTALLSGVGTDFRGKSRAELGPNPNRAIESKHSAINDMKPERTEQTHGQHPSRYEQVTANFAWLLAEFERTAVPLRNAITNTAVYAEDLLQPVDLRCEHRQNPLGIDTAHPRLSWILQATNPEARGAS
jgi:hypothetical protein